MPRAKRTRVDDSPEAERTTPKSAAEAKRVRWGGSQDPDDDTHTTRSSDDEDASSDRTRQVILTAWSQHGRLGCAYYDPARYMIYLLEDTQESAHFDLTTMLLEQANPDVALTSSKSDEEFIEVLRDRVEATGGICQIRSFKDFTPAKGRDRLHSLRLLADLSYDEPDLGDGQSSSGASGRRNAHDFMRGRREVQGDPLAKRWNAGVRLSNFISAENAPLCLASAGALIDHLVREQAFGDLDDEGVGGLDIREVELLSLNQVMQINSNALTSLQVFENESHASMHSEKTKEGLSLFGILNDTKTTLGRALLRSWLLRPSLSPTVIGSRLDAVECFSRPENIVTANTMHNHLKGIRNMPRTMNMLKTGRGRLSDWQGLVKFTFYMAMLRESLGELHEAGKVDVVTKLNDALDVAHYRDIGTRINEIVDWEESSLTGRVCVRSHVDEDLDHRKHMYHGINDVLSNVAQQISLKIPPDYASSLNVVYFPQLGRIFTLLRYCPDLDEIGYLICIPMPERWRTDSSIDVLDGWTFQFSSDEFVYFKSAEMRDMDSHIGDLHSIIVDRELEIIHALLEEILVHQKSIGEACDVCAELDCLLSFASASRAYNYTRPHIVEENIIDIKRGRHPLQEQVVDTFIENDARMIGGAGFGIRSSEQWNSILLCTGSNACGKSIYLKQIALIQIMAQIGCFVSAESAMLGLVDKIFTRVSTRESVSKVQSAFMIDLNQVSLALRNSTARSLIILDEFGKGTLSTDGAGIFCGVLKHLLNRRGDCPKVLVATHFHDVFREDILNPQELPITFCHMQVMFTASDGRSLSNDGDDESTTTRVLPSDKITYLYRVAKGLSLDSHAAKCAEIFGVPPQIVQRARHVSQLISSHELGQLLDEEMTEEEKRDLEESEAICRRFLKWDLQADTDVNVKDKLREVLGRRDLT